MIQASELLIVYILYKCCRSDCCSLHSWSKPNWLPCVQVRMPGEDVIYLQLHVCRFLIQHFQYTADNAIKGKDLLVKLLSNMKLYLSVY